VQEDGAASLDKPVRGNSSPSGKSGRSPSRSSKSAVKKVAKSVPQAAKSAVKKNAANKYARFLSPIPSNEQTEILKDWIIENKQGIKDGSFSLSETEEPIVGASSLVPDPPKFWSFDGSEIDNEVIHQFSLQSCNGCHGREGHREQSSTPFVHVGARKIGRAAAISEFFENKSIRDPRNSKVERFLFDFGRRTIALERLTDPNILEQVSRQQLLFVH
jgi:hypothetical protein